MSECLIYSRPEHLPAELVKALGENPTAAISDSMSRVGGAPGLRPMSKAVSLAGPALTVHTRPGDNLVVHKALDVAQPGEILVIAGEGNRERALVGGLACHYAARRGIAGIVIDGAVRDLDELGELDLPVFALDVSHQGPYKDGPGSIGGPVTMRGTAVHSGDVVVADQDGVVFVPQSRAQEVLEAAGRVMDNEARTMASIESDSWDRSFVDSLKVRHIARVEC